ncbi:uncharacterized protein LOC143849383 [Tasmannia lanceolata]|uniref:uncharacterized protein LOC143849383 n=1 Tax=Tasmannia lanceolata TaxID=3420 RepID=UPI0040642DF4
MQKQSALERVRQGVLGKGQKRKAPESTPPPVQDKGKGVLPDKGAKTSKVVKSTEGTWTGCAGGSSLDVVQAVLPFVQPDGDNVFRPNWGVQRDDSGLGDNRVAREIIMKSRLRNDRLRILHEPPETAEEAAFASIYQIGSYWVDLFEKCRNFSKAVTKSNLQIMKLKKDKTSLGRVIQERDEENDKLKEELKARSKRLRRPSVLTRQREKSQLKQLDAAVKAKEDELITLSMDSYKMCFADCKVQVREKYPDLILDDVMLSEPATDEEDDPTLPSPPTTDSSAATDVIPDLIRNRLTTA